MTIFNFLVSIVALLSNSRNGFGCCDTFWSVSVFSGFDCELLFGLCGYCATCIRTGDTAILPTTSVSLFAIRTFFLSIYTWHNPIYARLLPLFHTFYHFLLLTVKLTLYTGLYQFLSLHSPMLLYHYNTLHYGTGIVLLVFSVFS